MARRSSHPFSAAAPVLPVFLFFIFIFSSSSLSSAVAPHHQYSDDALTATATATPTWPLLQRPTLSLSQLLEVLEDVKANPSNLVINLPLPQPERQRPPRDEPQQQLLIRQGTSQSQSRAKGSGVGWRKCSYTVTIKTSCSSPRVTRDAVSIAFGDANGNEVYAARLDDPASGTFERCSVDTFRIVGPCGGRTCYLYLRRYGRDGWTPEYVKVIYGPSDPRAAVTFFYQVPLPDGVWYGFNLCHGGGHAL